MKPVEVLFTPADFAALAQRDLADATCVVFDVLRATTSIVTALAAGAASVRPVAGVSEALARRAADPGVLLAGERDGLRIGAALTGGVEFDLGNSPREFTAERVAGRRLVMTTTNGTRALRACAGAALTLAAAFPNLEATAEFLERAGPAELLLVGAGTGEAAAWEDALGAGALCDRLAAGGSWAPGDGALIARRLWRWHRHRLAEALTLGRNGQRLLDHPRLAPDLAACAAVDTLACVARMDADGALRRADGPA
ncbi:MAG TPA: 2-phosphosulfolactate phosphatase [Verrucomicrobiota bacterium]|nr:2-phosphosulfolactate phosphatase [Verrucomicrobiota bacterium]